MEKHAHPKLAASLLALALAAGLLALLATSRQAEAAFPDANGRIAFYDEGDVWTIPAGGGTMTRLTDNYNPEGNPAVSPDGSRIAYEFLHGIWVMNLDGSSKRMLTDGKVYLDEDPAWSADGTRVAFVRNNDIWSMNADGSGQRNLTKTQWEERDPAYSPKGDKIAYTRVGHDDQCQGPCVFTMNADGSGQTSLTSEDTIPGCEGSPSYSHDGKSKNPAWSPNGSQIVFSGSLICRNTSGTDLWVMDANGANKTNITNDNGTGDIQPAFSPDGNRIVFVRSENSLPTRLFTIPKGGGTATLLHAETAVDNPDWAPARPACATTDGEPNPALAGTPGDDKGADAIIGTAGDDVICDLGGNDVINGKGGHDIVLGESGDDMLVDGSGRDTLNGGLGIDTASFAASATAIKASLTSGFAQRVGSAPLEGVALVGVENLTGSRFADTLVGSALANALLGGAGVDSLFGLGGPDALNSRDGVSGNDRVDGGAGTDRCATDEREALVRGCE